MTSTHLPQMFPVQSRHITEIGFDVDTHTLYVKFVSGALYQYADVPETTYKSFSVAESKGKFFHRVIKDKFEGEIVEFPF